MVYGARNAALRSGRLRQVYLTDDTVNGNYVARRRALSCSKRRWFLPEGQDRIDRGYHVPGYERLQYYMATTRDGAVLAACVPTSHQDEACCGAMFGEPASKVMSTESGHSRIGYDSIEGLGPAKLHGLKSIGRRAYTISGTFKTQREQN